MGILNEVDTAYAATITANCMFFSLGSVITWTSPVLPKIENGTENIFNEKITYNQLTLIVTLPTIAASISGYFFTFLADYFGRKIVILSMGFPYMISYLIMSLTNHIEIYYITRFILGVAAGGTFSVVPIYSIEMSNKFNRVTLGSIAGVMICAGFLFSYTSVLWLTVKQFNLLLGIFPIFFIILFLTFGEETAHFYLMKNQDAFAKQALQKIRDKNEDVEEEFARIKNIITEQLKYKKTHFFKDKKFIKSFFSITGLFIFQQLTGINALLMLSETIFSLTKTDMDSSLCSIIFGTFEFASSFITPIIGARFGRKPLLIISSISMSIFLTCLGFYCFLTDSGVVVQSFKHLPIIILSLFTLGYHLGFGSIPFIIFSEVFPWRVKSLCVSVISMIYWASVFIMVNYFGFFITHLGLGICFLVLSVFCLISVVFVHVYIDETNGKTLEEIQDSWIEPDIIRY